MPAPAMLLGEKLLLPSPKLAMLTDEKAGSLPAWQYLLVPGAGIQHPLQLQLTQLALLHYCFWKSIP